jgi:hypothetical protein
VCTYACSYSSGTPFRRGSPVHGHAPRTGRLSCQRTGGAFCGVSRCRSASSRPGDGARAELAEFPRFRSAENECVDPLVCASACERARGSDVGGVGREARPRGEEKNEQRERESEGRSTFDEGGDTSAMGACVGVADGAVAWVGLRGDDALPVMVTAVSDDAIHGGGCGRSGRVLIVYMLCDGRVSEAECYGRGGRADLVLDAHFVLLCTLGVTCQDAQSPDSTWPVLAAPGERRRNP